MPGARDPTAIRSLAVTPDDVVDAFVYTRENPGRAVLRATSPFHGRMRARLHVYRVDDAPVTGAVHLDPERLLPGEVVAAYPSVKSFAGRANDADASDRREAHAAAIDTWRARAREAIVDEAEIDAGGHSHEVAIVTLG